eukprot:gene29702-38833_t
MAVILLVFTAVLVFSPASKGFSVVTTKVSTLLSPIQKHQKCGIRKLNTVVRSDLEVDESSSVLKRKAELLKYESEKLVKSVVNEPLPLLSQEFQATIDNLKSVIALNKNTAAAHLSSSLSGKLDIQEEKNWLLSDLTENGSPTFASSGSARLNLFFQVAENSGRDLMRNLLDASWAENSLDTLQIIAQLRDIRSGKADKSSAYHALEWLMEKHPLTCIENLKNLVEVGYWKDILNMLRWQCLGKRWEEPSEWREDSKTSDLTEAAILRRQSRIDCTSHAREAFEKDPLYRLLHLSVAALFAGELKKDLELESSTRNESFSSTAGKWAPSPKGFHDKSTLIASTIAELLFPRDTITFDASIGEDGEAKEVTYKDYIDVARMKYQTQVLSPLRRASAVPEVFMSAKQWHVLPYNRVPSVCMKKNVKNFEKHDGSRFDEYVSNVQLGKKKKLASGAVKPHELLQMALSTRDTNRVEFKVNELQWESYVDSLRSKGSLSSCLAVCDVSASMIGLPMDVAVSLSLMVAELANPPYNNIICTFSETPVMHEVKPGNLRERHDSMVRTDWGMNTDFNAVFSLILARAEAVKLPPEEMIRTVFVFSDMEFDQAQGNNYKTNFEAAKSEFESKGYSLPKLVFWNLKGDTRSTGRGASIPVRADEADVALVAGFSGQMLAHFMDGKLLDPPAEEEEEDQEDKGSGAEEEEEEGKEKKKKEKKEKVKVTPFETMIGIIKSGKYDQWIVVD